MPKDDITNTTTTTSSTTTTTSIPRISFSSTTSGLLRAYLDSNTPFLLLLPDVDINDRGNPPPSSCSFFAHATKALVTPGEEDDFKDIRPLVSLFGGENRVPVVETRGNESNESYGEEPRREMPLRDYAQLWEEGVAEAEGLYLKDWHIVYALRQRREPQEGRAEQAQSFTSPSSSSSPPPSTSFYTVPPPLNDDWLNEWWDVPAGEANHRQREDDYRFLYLGPAGSVTPYHHDVLCSYSWSVNLAGVKEWTLYPPPASSIGTETDTITPPSSLPSSSHTHTHTTPLPTPPPPPPILLTQHPNELLFVPSGWHHSVTNVTGCLSINHNWFNGSSVGRVWVFLRNEAHAVWSKLADLKETFVKEESVSGWERQCEYVLRANSAMNLTEWVDLMVGKGRRLRGIVRREGEGEGGGEEDGTLIRACEDLAAILQILQELALPPYVHFLFPPHLPCSSSEGRDGEEMKEEGRRLPSTEVLLPQVQAWLREQIEQIQESIHHL